ncbi:VWA domain-containing protein [Halorubellus sp. PRR65]|uniref:vWA domain-containing protein n=1 Tax=Halorubellus sp. PRR65 TaxID=3098148 RepID=UPI002B25956E|nr:VWA domain-containing protein [Halorubellus sp. PRR65]
MSPHSRRTVLSLATAATAALAGCNGRIGNVPPSTDDDGRVVDDWQYSPGDLGGDGGAGGAGGGSNATFQAASSGGGATESVGLAAGGAKDANTFRRNVENDYLPIPSSLSYEGLFYDYYFDTGDAGACSDLFCPRYAPAVTADPLSEETERYLSVGLNSGLDADSFDRKRLNLVLVLDISGSMGSSFDEYYYDQYGNKQTVEASGSESKMAVAKDALASVTEKLRPGDRLGVVLYNSDAAVAKPLNPVAETDMDAIRGHIEEDIRPGGGTNLDAGMDDALSLLDPHANADQTTYENRMIVLTDAMPNVGETSDEGLRGRLATAAAERNVHATFVGVGVDFNTEIVDEITSVRGANYYSVHSPAQFRERVVEQFEYMVTPLVFDLSLDLDADGYEIERVYGSSAADESTGRMLSVNTLFASPTADGRTKGGVVLAKVSRTDDGSGDGSLRLRASWEDRTGERSERETTVEFPDGGPDEFANTGVRKAVLLSRYADLLKSWMVAERERDGEPTADGVPVYDDDHLGEWEQQSDPLSVSREYRDRIGAFAEHFEREMDAVGDDALQQELDLLRTLAAYRPEESIGTGSEGRTVPGDVALGR